MIQELPGLKLTNEILTNEIAFYQMWKHDVIKKAFKLYYVFEFEWIIWLVHPPKTIRKPIFSDGFRSGAKFDWFSWSRFILDAKFIYSDKKASWTRWDLRIRSRDLPIDSTHIWSMQMLVMPYPCALFEPSSLIIFLNSPGEK